MKDKTYLKNSFCNPPFKVANITEDKNAHQLQLMLMSSSPGILSGDRYDLSIELEEGSSLQLHTQSYQRLFSMKEAASQSLKITMRVGSSLVFLPHPTVPHTNAVYRATNKIYLEEKCSLIFGEILTCGRRLNGEIFAFSKYHNTTEIFLKGKLVIKENLLIEPNVLDPKTIGQLEGFTHQASLVVLQIVPLNFLVDLIDKYLCSQESIMYGITNAPVNGLIVRVLGFKAEQLHDCLKMIASMVPQR